MDALPNFGPEEWKSLYQDKNGLPRLRRSVVAFIDLLGYRSAVVRAHLEGRQLDLLLKLRRAFDQTFALLRDAMAKAGSPTATGDSGRPFIAVRPELIEKLERVIAGLEESAR